MCPISNSGLSDKNESINIEHTVCAKPKGS